MKGRTTCPKCKNEFELDVPDTTEEHEVVCPECGIKFAIIARNSDPESDDDFSWEEHGEPRKTILSSNKTKTNKPMMVAILFRVVDLFKIFDKVYMLTRGGPATATQTATMYVYFRAFRYFRIGWACAASFILLILILIPIMIILKLLSPTGR